MRVTPLSILVLAACLVHPTATWAVTIDLVPVANLGNPNDDTGYGSVSYDYYIGRTEVTVGQYVEFLNAVADTDTYGLYDPFMGTNTEIGGITQSGSPGTYTYSVRADSSANMPMTYVSWGDAARFANWLHNGQPTGAQDASTTEDGAYTLNGANTDSALNAVTRNTSIARWFIPTENEWYKAAYHRNNGATGDYWDYPTGTDTAPSNSITDTGNNASYWGFSGPTKGTEPYLTDAGHFATSESPYDTLDQGGSVWEWNEALLYDKFRSLRGGAWNSAPGSMLNTYRSNSNVPTFTDNSVGFRVASIPEPSTAVLGIMASMAIWVLYRRKMAL